MLNLCGVAPVAIPSGLPMPAERARSSRHAHKAATSSTPNGNPRMLEENTKCNLPIERLFPGMKPAF